MFFFYRSIVLLFLISLLIFSCGKDNIQPEWSSNGCRIVQKTPGSNEEYDPERPTYKYTYDSLGRLATYYDNGNKFIVAYNRDTIKVRSSTLSKGFSLDDQGRIITRVDPTIDRLIAFYAYDNNGYLVKRGQPGVGGGVYYNTQFGFKKGNLVYEEFFLLSRLTSITYSSLKNPGNLITEIMPDVLRSPYFQVFSPYYGKQPKNLPEKITVNYNGIEHTHLLKYKMDNKGNVIEMTTTYLNMGESKTESYSYECH